VNPSIDASGWLVDRFPGLERLGGGHHSLVYRAGNQVLKVYHQRGVASLERKNLETAGLASLVVSQLSLPDGREVLVLRYFPGRPAVAADLPGAVPAIRSFLDQLHARPAGLVPADKVAERLRSFSPLLDPALLPLFEAAEAAGGAVPAGFCHLDLWADNILIAEDGRVMIVDWVRAGPEDPLRDLALLKTGTLDLLPADQSLELIVAGLPVHLLPRLRAHLVLTYLHDIYWLYRNDSDQYRAQFQDKLARARHVLAAL
jgi:hypothetical protein